jgi:prepilin-type N-terminal cleavage/methylation domain-containing protein
MKHPGSIGDSIETGFPGVPAAHVVRDRRGRAGLTLIEILVVIAVIGTLMALGTYSTLRARELAKKAKAQGDLKQILTGIELLEQDTGKWPNGCPPNATANPEVNLSDPQAGLDSQPQIGDQGDGCFWTADDIGRWRGPYAQFKDDPYGNPYWFDPDYTPYQNCPGKPADQLSVVIESFGPNGVGVNTYDCDDIFVKLK